MDPIDSLMAKKLNIKLSSISKAISGLLRMIKFDKYGSEHEQSIIRIVIISLILGSLCFVYDRLNPEIPVIWSAYAVFSVIILFETRKHPVQNLYRQIFTLLMDISATSLTVFITNEIGVLFIGVYLWLIIGYGLRYGKSLFMVGYVASLAGFVIATLMSPHWHSHAFEFYGVLVTLIAVPLHNLRLLNKLKEATVRAESANKAKSQFLSHISHEIRTPLNGIVGASSLLSEASGEVNQEQLLNVIKSSSEILQEIINNVLDLSKIESGKISSNNEDFNLQALIIETINLFSPQAVEKNLLLSYHVSKETPVNFHGDVLHIKQVLMNLIGNAIKFTEKGYVKVSVESLSQSASKAVLRFEIEDSGIGMSSDSLKSIFDSFVQAGEEIKFKFGGTGLGTTISKNLVEFMGGDIGVDSVLGHGTTFWFEIPLDKSKGEVHAKSNPNEIVSLSDYKKNNKKQKKSFHILVADDNDTNSMILTQMIALEKHTFEVVSNGQDALDKLLNNHYDLMILDCNMPIMSGKEVISLYRAMNIGKDLIPCIVVSADATVENIASLQELGVDAYLTKPIQMVPLLRTINEVVSVDAGNEIIVEQPRNEAPQQNKKSVLVDMARLDSLARLGDKSFITMLITDFVRDTDENFAELVESATDLDYDKVIHISHAIAGGAANMGADELAKLCQKMESIKPTQGFGEMMQLLEDSKLSYEKTREICLNYISALDKKMPFSQGVV